MNIGWDNLETWLSDLRPVNRVVPFARDGVEEAAWTSCHPCQAIPIANTLNRALQTFVEFCEFCAVVAQAEKKRD